MIPVPTVIWPSLIVKRNPSCKANGAIKLTVTSTVSPGKTASTSFFNMKEPVTSAVLIKNCGL